MGLIMSSQYKLLANSHDELYYLYFSEVEYYKYVRIPAYFQLNYHLPVFFIKARVSIKRLEEFLGLKELDPNCVQRIPCKRRHRSVHLRLLY